MSLSEFYVTIMNLSDLRHSRWNIDIIYGLNLEFTKYNLDHNLFQAFKCVFR